MAATIRTDKIGPVSGSADFTLPTADGSAKSALITDGSKALSFATGTPSASNFLRGDGTWASAGGDNTPAWHVGINSSTQSIPDATQTIVELDDVKFDTGFTWDTTNYKGVPGTAGKYLIGVYADFDPSSNAAMWVYLFKNTTSMAFFGSEDTDGTQHLNSFGGTTILDLNDTDYVQMKVYMDFPSGSATIRQHDANDCVTYMFGMLLIGA